MRRPVTMVLAALLALAACSAPAPDPVPEPPAPPRAESAPAKPAPEPEPAAEKPSAVQALARERAAELGIAAGQGEAAIRRAYRHLIETVYFADPVGLDAWRYLQDDDSTPIPFLENRALSPLLFGIGSCEDFAAALVMLLRAAGFEAEYVAGYTLSVEQVYIDHAWAMVRLEENWYHLDPQLEQNVMKGGLLTYRYYMKADGEMARDHKWGENLIAHWPDMPEWEQQAIRLEHTPPPCPLALEAPAPEPVPEPPRGDRGQVEATIRRLQAESGKGELAPIALRVEPPVLVAEHHVTPPLLETQPAFGRSGLEGAEGALYDRLADWVPELDEETALPLPEMDSAAVKRAVDAFTADFAEYYWVRFEVTETAHVRGLTATPTLDRAQRRAQRAEIEAAAQAVTLATSGLPPFEAALYIHDYLAEQIRYDNAATRDGGNLYGALVGRTAFCDGYARAFQFLAGRAGLRCAYLSGRSRRGVDHAWNAVELDGAWHYIDVTWDRPLHPDDRVYHDYFLMDAQELLRERQESGQGLVAAGGEGVCYYRRAGYALEGEPDAEQLAAVFLRQLAACWEDPAADAPAPFFLEAKVCGGREDYERWKECYIKQVFEILRAMETGAREGGLPFSVSFDTSVRCNFNDPMQVLTFYPLVSAHTPVIQMEESR